MTDSAQRVMYGQNRINPMPNFFDYNLWDEYMGSLWQGLFTGYAIPPSGTLVEVAPGATAKIAVGLAKMGFIGKLYIIEPHPEVSQCIYHKTVKLLPKAEVVLCPDDFRDVTIPEPIDAILANHPFDDFLSAEGTNDGKKQTVLFQDISKEGPEALEILKETWRILETQPERLFAIKGQIRSDWAKFVNRHQPRRIMLSQYASSYYEKKGLSVINTHAKDLFAMIRQDCKHPKPIAQIQEILNQNEHYRNLWIGTELLNAGNWLIDER